MNEHAPVLDRGRPRLKTTIATFAGPLPPAGWLAGLGIVAQIAYPLLSGPALRAATIASVLLLAAAALVDAGARWGARAGLVLLAVAGGIGLLAETVGVHTGFPFGTYAYSGGLGPRLAGVPVLVPLAWAMLAYPCLLLGRRLAAGRVQTRVRTAVTGGLALAAWDLFLDPQMVAQGHWTWAHPEPALPGVPGVPLTNYAGWLLVAVLMIAALDRALPRGRNRPVARGSRLPSSTIGETAATTGQPATIGEAVPAAVLAWTWLGSAVGNLVFFDRPATAFYGGLAMAVTVLPYLRSLTSKASKASKASEEEP